MPIVNVVKHKKWCNVIAMRDFWDHEHGVLRRRRKFIHPKEYRELYLELERQESYCTCGVAALASNFINMPVGPCLITITKLW